MTAYNVYANGTFWGEYEAASAEAALNAIR